MLALLMAALLTACGTSTLDGDDLAKDVESRFQDEVPDLVDGEVKCPDVKLNDGEQDVRCQRHATLDNGVTVDLGVSVTVKTTKDKTHFQMRADDAPEYTYPGDLIADDVSQRLSRKVGDQPDDVTCPDVKGKKGEEVSCELVDGSATYQVKLNVVDIRDDNIDYEIKVADEPSK